MRPQSGHVRLLLATIALAIASPANLPTWPVDREPTAAHAATPSPAIQKAAPRPAWHAAGWMVSVDPSDEPDEGSQGWFPAATAGLIVRRDHVLAEASRPAAPSPGPARHASLAGVSCRLRC